MNAIVAAIVGSLLTVFGAFITLLATLYIQRWRREQERRSLLLAFCTELVFLFHRCILYYRQALKGGVSFSTLFIFTDASAFSKFAALHEEPKVIGAILELKSSYFQVKRHTDPASKYAIESEMEKKALNIVEAEQLGKKAKQAQEAALAFFLTPDAYSKIVKHTALLLEETLNEFTESKYVKELSETFSRDTEEKKRLDVINEKGQSHDIPDPNSEPP